MIVHEKAEIAAEPRPATATLSRVSDMGAANKIAVDALERATAVATDAKIGIDLPRPPHPGPLTWVDMSDQVCQLGRGGATVRQIATALGLSKSQVEAALTRGGIRRLHAAPVAVGRRSFDRAAALAARRQGVSVRDLANRFGVSPQSIRLAIKKEGAP